LEILERSEYGQRNKVHIVGVNDSAIEIGKRQILTATARVHDVQALVNRAARGIVHGQKRGAGIVAVDRGPGRNGAILSRKKKLRRSAADEKVLRNGIEQDTTWL